MSGGIVRAAERRRMIIYRCPSCSLDFATGNGLHSVSAFATDPNYYHDSKAQFSEQLERARSLVGKRLAFYAGLLGRRPGRVLEIGCGSGAYGQAFTDEGLDYCAIEIDDEMAEFAKSASGQHIIAGDFLEVDLPWVPDIVFLSQVMEHMPKPAAFLQRLRKVAPGALLHIDVPNQNGLASFYRKLKSNDCYGSMHFPFHMIGYSHKSLRRLLESENIQLHVLRSYRNDHPTWGHLTHNRGLPWKAYYRLSQLTDRASLLVGIGSVPRSGSDGTDLLAF